MTIEACGYARDPELAEATTELVAAALDNNSIAIATDIVLTVARKTQQAIAACAQITADATELALTTTPASAWAEFTVRLAEAEGAAYAWTHLDVAVTHSAEHGEVNCALVVNVALHLLAAGAGDGWSGQVNDVQRARFDGIREACAAMQWLDVMLNVKKYTDLLCLDQIARGAGVHLATADRWRGRNLLPEPDLMLGNRPGWDVATITAWAADTKRKFDPVLARITPVPA